MASYHFNSIEENWQKYWAENKTFKAENISDKPKYYVLDMFPYPSGAGLHVGHPLGYIASDIVSRFKRHKGFNVLHPMGYDAFGLPAEQYAIQTGKHPAITTHENIIRYRKQLDRIGFSFDWDKEIRTSNPHYYKWTQWIFIQLFNSWYNPKTNKAEDISSLIKIFEKNGYQSDKINFTKFEWKKFTEKQKTGELLNFRLAFLSEIMVNWCPALGSVLANDEIKEGVSERGGYPVERKLMSQWSLRISAYADRLLNDLETLDWTDSIKEAQRNWIGKSEGCSIKFEVDSNVLTQIPINNSGEIVKAPSKAKNSSVSFEAADKDTYHKLIKLAKTQKENPTKEEDILWKILRDRQFENIKFRKQYIINKFIVDFVSFEYSLILEIDGLIHSLPDNIISDENRTLILNELGFKILRFTNDEITNNVESVLKKIKDFIKYYKPSCNSTAEKGIKARSDNKEDEAKEIYTLENNIDNPIENSFFIEVFTTRPDTIFGVSYLTLAPENELVLQITHKDYLEPVLEYINTTKKRSERERQADVKNITGVFSGTYAKHPFTGKQIPVWIGDYVLAGYGTGAVMAVPAHDSRDYAFAKHFNLPIKEVVLPEKEVLLIGEDFGGASYDLKIGKMINSDFLNDLDVKDAIKKAIQTIEEKQLGKGKINFRLRDAVFGRQRYWGEPIPVYYDNGIPKTMDESDLPLILPKVDKYLPTETGEPPLARADNWQYKGNPLENTTMPGWAGSSWYYLRYMDANNTEALANKNAINYWQNVDLYIGGSEHAVGHLLYSRFWCKFLKDIGIVPFEEPFKKLVNQGMIQGMSMLIYRVNEENKFISFGLKDNYQTTPIHIDINLVSNNVVNIEGLKKWRPSEFQNAEFELEDGKLLCGNEVGKMSKRWHNVVNPDDICIQYGADTLRLYEMFLGPLQDAKPWSTQGIEGVHRFLKKTWRLFHNNANEDFAISQEEPTKAELKILHKTIKKATEDIENFSFNTSVSAFMVCVNELQDLKCNKLAILEKFIILLSPYAPHITEELYKLCGNQQSIEKAEWPLFNAEYLIENEFNYPISFSGKVKFNLNFALDKDLKEIENEVIANEQTQKYLEGKAPKKIIVVKGRIVNVVV